MEAEARLNSRSKAKCGIRQQSSQRTNGLIGKGRLDSSLTDAVSMEYVTTKAEGSAFIVQGNVGQVTINRISPGAPEQKELEDFSILKGIRNADKPNQPHELLPLQSHSFDAPRPLPAPPATTTGPTAHPVRRTAHETNATQRSNSISFPVKPLVASANASFIGLEDIDNSNVFRGGWEAELETQAVCVRVAIVDASADYEPCERYWASSTVSLEARCAVHNEHRYKRLKITETMSSVLWLPETRIQVHSNDRIVNIRFSNCNKLGLTRMTNGCQKSETVYDPEKPNVSVYIEFASVEKADDFNWHLLRKTAAKNDSRQPAQKFKHCEFIQQGRGVRSPEENFSVFVWKQDINPKGKLSYEEHDRFSFSDRLDLYMNFTGQQIRLSLGYIVRLEYRTAQDHPALRWNIKRTPDGRPASVDIEATVSPLRTSKLELVTSLAESKQLMNSLINKKISWRFETVYPPRKMKIGWRREQAVQLTLWSNVDKVRILMRAVDPEDRDDIRPNLPRWFAVTLRSEARLTARLKKQKNEGVIVIINKISCEEGPDLFTRDLRPASYDAVSANKSNFGFSSVKLELKFADKEEWERFQRIVTAVYLKIA